MAPVGREFIPGLQEDKVSFHSYDSIFETDYIDSLADNKVTSRK